MKILSDRLIPVAMSLVSLTFVVPGVRAAEAGKHKTLAASNPIAASDDGTVKGTLSLDGKVTTLHHIYGRKREAWPADVQELSVDGIGDLSCGIVDVIITNLPVSDAVLTSILQNEYHGSEKIRGVCLTFEGSGKHSFVHSFLLASGASKGFGITQSTGEINEEHGRVIGAVKCKNEENLAVRVFDVSFDTGVRLQYTQTVSAEPVPADQFLDEYLRVMPGNWNIERWVELGCASASGTLSIVERSRPNEFRGTFRLLVSVPGKPDRNVEEDVTITRNGTKVHLEGGEIRGADESWTRDVLDFELRKGLLVGGAATDCVVLRKTPDSAQTRGVCVILTFDLLSVEPRTRRQTSPMSQIKRDCEAVVFMASG